MLHLPRELASSCELTPRARFTCHSLLAVGGNLYSVIQFESPYPAVFYMMQLTTAANGALSITPGTLTPVSFAPYGGSLFMCAGSTSPWQSHLGGEESTGVNARDFAGTFNALLTTGITSAVGYNTVSLDTFSHSMRYFGIYPNALTAANVVANFDPYMYGFIHEVKVTGPGTYTAVKHLNMGRAGWEMPYVMPDNATTYLAADMSSGGFWKHVATTPGDLSSGIIYCATMTQTSATNGGAFTIAWTALTSAAVSDATALGWVNGTANGGAAQLTFDDIFTIDLPTGNVTGACNAGFTAVNTGYTYTVAGVKYYHECLKLNAANPNAAAQAAVLETNRYSAMLGCTTEFNKWEGITFSPRRKQLYTALSYWTSGGMMAATSPLNTADIGGSNDVSLPAQPCGCVYYLNVDSTYSATDMTALVCGTSQAADANGNTCAVTGVSSPDNVAMIEDFDTLIIGEDTSTHRVDFMWQYAFPNAPGTGVPSGGSLTPIFSTTLGAETTSPYWHNMGNGLVRSRQSGLACASHSLTKNWFALRNRPT